MRCVLPLLLLSLTGFVPAPVVKPGPVKGDLKSLQGEWVLDYTILDSGTKARESPAPVWTIAGEHLLATDGSIRSEYTLRLGPSSSPPSIDLISFPGSEPRKGRYRLSGDTLTVSFGDKRPADLSGRLPSDGARVFKRKKH
jgi:uncharacterized protein (TIGR03067 family)